MRNGNLKTRRGLSRALFSTDRSCMVVPSALGFECFVAVSRQTSFRYLQEETLPATGERGQEGQRGEDRRGQGGGRPGREVGPPVSLAKRAGDEAALWPCFPAAWRLEDQRAAEGSVQGPRDTARPENALFQAPRL